MQNFKLELNKIRKMIIILLSFLFLGFSFENSVLASPVSQELSKCIVVTHCVLNNWKSNEVEKGFQEAYQLIKDTPRTKIVEESFSYVHAESTTRWMHYVDDLELKALPEKGIIQIRSESRVGIGDNGVNKKRIDNLENKMSYIIK